MDLAADFAREGAPEGVVVVADEQTAGRGRRGRRWISPRGGLYLSIVLRPCLDTHVASHVTLMTGVAVRDGIVGTTGLSTELKWPNDVMVRRRKLGGILAEGWSLGTPDQFVVVGIGVNVLRSAFPPGVAERATSIEEETGQAADRSALRDCVLAAFSARYEQLCAGDADGILRAWRDASPSAYGARVAWDDGAKRGITAGIDDSGALLIENDGGIERVIAGELTWL
jgi:BirA family transcriptional regulator, biotin operon repressor / biotin---[acetyl-CoA-carboxylase] ligase